jgi:methyl-accepting chemotaxis protein
LIGFSAFIIAAMTYFVHELTDVMVESSEASSFKLMRSVIADVLSDTEEAALVRAELISSLPAVRRAFAKRDRTALLDECKDMFAEQKDKYGMDEGQFHAPPGVSFLHLHAPDRFGDDQSGARPMLADVIKNKVHRKGVVLAPTGVFVTSIVPMEDMDDKPNGSFEMGLELGPVLDEVKKAYGMEASLFIDEKLLRDVAVELKGDVLSDKNRVGPYIRFHATHTELARALVKDTDVDVVDAVSYDRVANGQTWGVQLVPLYDYANKRIGVVALAKDFSEVTAMEGRSRVWQLLAAGFAVVLLSGVVLVVIRGMLLRPLAALNERMAALAAGDASQPADDLSTYCDELRTLAESYERLRAGKQP